jgi:Flp pilus assembly protein TadG
VLLEFVLVLPFVALFLLGAIDWGWYFVLRQTAIEATRSGARVGSVQLTEAEARATAESAVEQFLAQAGFEVRSPAVDVVDGDGFAMIDVSLEYPAGSVTGWPTLVPDTITARSVMRLEVQPPP